MRAASLAVPPWTVTGAAHGANEAGSVGPRDDASHIFNRFTFPHVPALPPPELLYSSIFWLKTTCAW